jgi:hypothetical protein
LDHQGSTVGQIPTTWDGAGADAGAQWAHEPR